MRKIIFLSLSLTFITISPFGCQSKDNTEVKPNLEFQQVSISKSNGFGNVNPDFFAVFDDEKKLKIFKDVISSANKEPGTVNMAEPEFDLEVIYKNGKKQGLHLWLGEKGQRSTFMNIEDTNTIYTVLEEMTNRLIDLIQ